MHMIRKGQLMIENCAEMSFAGQFFFHWQGKPVQFQGLAPISAKISFISG